MDKNILIVPWENEFGEYKQLFSIKCFRCSSFLGSYPASKYMFKVNSRNTETRCEICQKLTIKTPESRSVVFIVNFEHGSHLVLVFFFCYSWSCNCRLGHCSSSDKTNYFQNVLLAQTCTKNISFTIQFTLIVCILWKKDYKKLNHGDGICQLISFN